MDDGLFASGKCGGKCRKIVKAGQWNKTAYDSPTEQRQHENGNSSNSSLSLSQSLWLLASLVFPILSCTHICQHQVDSLVLSSAILSTFSLCFFFCLFVWFFFFPVTPIFLHLQRSCRSYHRLSALELPVNKHTSWPKGGVAGWLRTWYALCL